MGRANKVWRLIGDQDLIFQAYLNSSSNPLFADTPTAEYQCLSLLKGTGVAPDLSPGMHMIYGTGNLTAFECEAFLRGLSLYLRARDDQFGLLYHWRLAAYSLWRVDQGELGYEGDALAEIALLEEVQ